MQRKLYRSRSDAMIAGVCSGLGHYLGIDPTLVRLFFLILAFGNGIGVLVYFLFWIIVPPDDAQRDVSFEDTVRSGSEEIAQRTRAMGSDLRNMVERPNPQAGLIIGAALVFLGLILFIQSLHLPWLNWLNFDTIWPVLLILGGGALLLRSFRGE